MGKDQRPARVRDSCRMYLHVCDSMLHMRIPSSARAITSIKGRRLCVHWRDHKLRSLEIRSRNPNRR